MRGSLFMEGAKSGLRRRGVTHSRGLRAEADAGFGRVRRHKAADRFERRKLELREVVAICDHLSLKGRWVVGGALRESQGERMGGFCYTLLP